MTIKIFFPVETQLKHEERWPSVISELHILKLTEDDFGEYTCTMNTMMGKHSASTTLERKFCSMLNTITRNNNIHFMSNNVDHEKHC